MEWMHKMFRGQRDCRLGIFQRDNKRMSEYQRRYKFDGDRISIEGVPLGDYYLHIWGQIKNRMHYAVDIQYFSADGKYISTSHLVELSSRYYRSQMMKIPQEAWYGYANIQLHPYEGHDIVTDRPMVDHSMNRDGPQYEKKVTLHWDNTVADAHKDLKLRIRYL